MKAIISLGQNDGLVAHLEAGGRIIATTSLRLAYELHEAGVSADEVTPVNWKTDPDHAPMAGQIIAINAELRRLAWMDTQS